MKKMQKNYKKILSGVINLALVLGILCVPSLPAGAGIKIALTVIFCVLLTIGCNFFIREMKRDTV